MSNVIGDCGYDLSYPLISQPEQHSQHKMNNVFEKKTEQMTFGYDLSWPRISRPEQQETVTQQKRAA